MKKAIDIIYNVGLGIFVLGFVLKRLFNWPYHEYLYYIFGITLLAKWIYNICHWKEFKNEWSYKNDLVFMTIITIIVFIFLFIK